MSTPLADIEIHDVVVVARPHGDLDVASADPLTAMIADAVPNTALGLVVDLARVRYVDSAGVRMLFTLLTRLRTRQQTMRLAVPPEASARRILAIVGLSDALEVHDDLGEAVAALKQAHLVRSDHDAGPA